MARPKFILMLSGWGKSLGKSLGNSLKRRASSTTCQGDLVATTTATTTTSSSKDGPIKCEIKHLRLKDDGEKKIYFDQNKEEVKNPRMFAFCLVKPRYDKNDDTDSDSDTDGGDDDVDMTVLHVNHQPLRQLLNDVMGDCPIDSIHANDVRIKYPYCSLFYFRKELESEGHDRFENDEDSKAQLKLLMTWIKTRFDLDIAAYDNCTSSNLKAISYDTLWTLFRPRTIIYSKHWDQHRAYRVDSCDYGTNALYVNADYVSFDGQKFGTVTVKHTIPKYDGLRKVKDLETMPFDLLEDAGKIRAELVERGRKFESYVGQHVRQYDGLALTTGSQGSLRPTNVKERIMIDFETCDRFGPFSKLEVTELENIANSNEAYHRVSCNDNLASAPQKFAKLSDENALINHGVLRGYALETNQFMLFSISNVSPVEWNTRCFEDLVLDQETKKTIQSLVSTHLSNRDSFNDIGIRKSQGLVALLQYVAPGILQSVLDSLGNILLFIYILKWLITTY